MIRDVGFRVELKIKPTNHLVGNEGGAVRYTSLLPRPTVNVAAACYDLCRIERRREQHETRSYNV